MILFDYYPSDIKHSRPLGRVSLDQFYRAIKDPKPQLKQVFYKLRNTSDPAEKNLLKTHLYAFTPCVQISGRRCYSDISEFTGIAVLDFDKITNASEFKAFIFEKYNSIMASWLSASGRGVRALVSIPVCRSVEEFKLYFAGIAQEFRQYVGFDRAPKNPVLPLFLSWDPEILIRDNAVVWKQIYKEPKPQYSVQYKGQTNDSDSVVRIIKSHIDKIHDNGHPQLRAAAFAMGGYVGSGYISFDSAISAINDMIHSNEYLSQKPDVYKRTAREMIEKGVSKPLYTK